MASTITCNPHSRGRPKRRGGGNNGAICSHSAGRMLLA
jgi:hypothetical protein